MVADSQHLEDNSVAQITTGVTNLLKIIFAAICEKFDKLDQAADYIR